MPEMINVNGQDVERLTAYSLTADNGDTYLIFQDREHASSRHTVNRVTFSADGSATLTPVDRWFGLADATSGALADASRRSQA